MAARGAWSKEQVTNKILETLNFNEGTYVLVRYSENSNYFASHYVELEF